MPPFIPSQVFILKAEDLWRYQASGVQTRADSKAQKFCRGPRRAWVVFESPATGDQPENLLFPLMVTSRLSALNLGWSSWPLFILFSARVGDTVSPETQILTSPACRPPSVG